MMKQYEIILADPPWAYANWTDAKQGAAVAAYPVMKDKDIIGLDVGAIAANDSMLLLWATWPKLEIALKAMASWGFDYVTTPEVWVKTNADGSPYHGIGFWALGGSEFMLMGRKGKGIPRVKETKGKIKQVHTSPRLKHSEKPPGVRDKIISMMGDRPRIELFSRKVVEGWDSTGFDLDGVDIRTFLGMEGFTE